LQLGSTTVSFRCGCTALTKILVGLVLYITFSSGADEWTLHPLKFTMERDRLDTVVPDIGNNKTLFLGGQDWSPLSGLKIWSKLIQLGLIGKVTV
jgi:hypothetical protein